jgi:hypothetical protein
MIGIAVPDSDREQYVSLDVDHFAQTMARAGSFPESSRQSNDPMVQAAIARRDILRAAHQAEIRARETERAAVVRSDDEWEHNGDVMLGPQDRMIAYREWIRETNTREARPAVDSRHDNLFWGSPMRVRPPTPLIDQGYAPPEPGTQSSSDPVVQAAIDRRDAREREEEAEVFRHTGRHTTRAERLAAEAEFGAELDARWMAHVNSRAGGRQVEDQEMREDDRAVSDNVTEHYSEYSHVDGMEEGEEVEDETVYQEDDIEASEDEEEDDGAGEYQDDEMSDDDGSDEVYGGGDREL